MSLRTAPAGAEATIQNRPGELGGRWRWLALFALTAGFLMIILDKTIVDVAMPTIQHDLRFSVSGLTWVVNAYLITSGGLLLLAGRLGDLIGHRHTFLAGLTVFTSASLAAGLAHSQAVLITARLIQGIGAALSSTVVLGMIVTMFTKPAERARAIGIYSFVATTGGIIGLLAGGFIIQLLNWHWIFFVNVPIGVLTGVFATRLLPRDRGIGLRRGADTPGAVLLVAALMLAVYTIAEASTYSWGSAHTLGFGAASVALLAAFVVREARTTTPLVPLRLFSSRTVNAANAAHAALFAAMAGLFFLGALYMQRVLHYDAIEVGVAFLPFGVASVTMSLGFTHRVILRFGARAAALTGLALAAAGLALLSRVPVHGHYVTDLLPAMVLIGLSGGLTCPGLFSLGMSAATPEDSGLASGFVSTATQYGSALGLAVLATLSSNRTTALRAGGHSPASAFTGGFHLAFTVATALIAAGIALVLLVKRDPRSADAGQDGSADIDQDGSADAGQDGQPAPACPPADYRRTSASATAASTDDARETQDRVPNRCA